MGRATAVALLLSTNAWAIGVGNTSNSVSAGSDGTAVSALAWNHTVAGGTNRAIAVCIGATDNIGLGIGASSCTYNSVAMTKLRTDACADGGGTDCQTDLFYLVAPSIGTNSISCTLNGDNKIVMGGAVDFSGVHQTSPMDESGGEGVTGANASTLSDTITTTAPKAVYLYCAQYKNDTGTPVTSGGETEVTNTTLTDATNSGDFVMGFKEASTPGVQTVTYTGGPADDGVISLLSFAPARRKVSIA